jgi:hypothetical protein
MVDILNHIDLSSAKRFRRKKVSANDCPIRASDVPMWVATQVKVKEEIKKQKRQASGDMKGVSLFGAPDSRRISESNFPSTFDRCEINPYGVA